MTILFIMSNCILYTLCEIQQKKLTPILSLEISNYIILCLCRITDFVANEFVKYLRSIFKSFKYLEFN